MILCIHIIQKSFFSYFCFSRYHKSDDGMLGFQKEHLIYIYFNILLCNIVSASIASPSTTSYAPPFIISAYNAPPSSISSSNAPPLCSSVHRLHDCISSYNATPSTISSSNALTLCLSIHCLHDSMQCLINCLDMFSMVSIWELS